MFDASDPDREPLSGEIESGTRASTQGTRTGTLGTVSEEQQASEVRSGDLRGTKRSRDAETGDDGDVAMVGSTADADSGADTLEGMHRAKRRALDANTVPPSAAGAPATVPASTQTQGQGKGQTTTGAKPTSKFTSATSKPSSSNNKLDTDENFLKAVNSTKRGKKHEDNFDREFNQLRITKPRNVNVDTIGSGNTVTGVPEADVAPWDAIDDFGDVGIRGNFMVVVEMDIQRGASAKPAPTSRNNDVAHPEWAGKPNFKKFKMVWMLFTRSHLGKLTSEWVTEKHGAYRAQTDGRARFQRG